MKKHLIFKASVLLIVMFFHSFVLVPKSYAVASTGLEKSALRLVWNAASPAGIKAAQAAGQAALVGWRITGVVGLAYILYTSGALTKMVNWWNAQVGTAQHAADYYSANGTHIQITAGDPGHWNLFLNGNAVVGNGTWQAILDGIHAYVGNYPAGVNDPGAMAAPTVPTDYGGSAALDISPGLSTGDLKGTQLAGPMLAGTSDPRPESIAFLSSGDGDTVSAALGMTDINPATGAQPNPTTNDNTYTAGDAHTSGLLQQIINYVANLVGIKTDTGKISSNTDNLVAGQSAQTSAANQSLGKLDNIAILAQAQKSTLDHLDNAVKALSTPTVTEGSLSSRLSAVQSLLSTKFPFSIVSSIQGPGTVSGGTYEIPDLVFPLGVTITVDPMRYPQMATFVGFVRGLMAVGMWAMFVLIMIRRVTQI